MIEGQLTMDDLLTRGEDPGLLKLKRRYESCLMDHDRWDPYHDPMCILESLDTAYFGSEDPLYIDLKQKLIAVIDTEHLLDLYEPHRMDEFYGCPWFMHDRVKKHFHQFSSHMPTEYTLRRRNPKHDHMTESEFEKYKWDGLCEKWKAEKQEAI